METRKPLRVKRDWHFKALADAAGCPDENLFGNLLESVLHRDAKIILTEGRLADMDVFECEGKDKTIEAQLINTLRKVQIYDPTIEDYFNISNIELTRDY